MMYFKIDIASVSERGVVPQSRRMTEGYQYDVPNSITKIKIETPPNLDAIQLDYRAKLTDWISSMNTVSNTVYFIASEKLSEIILGYKVQKELQLFDAIVAWRKKRYNYKCLYSYNLGKQFIDFEKSSFIETHWILYTEQELLEVKNVGEYENFEDYYLKSGTKSRSRLNIKKLVFKEKEIDVDFFRLNLNIASGYFVSKKLKNAIEEANCTGIIFKAVEELNWVK